MIHHLGQRIKEQSRKSDFLHSYLHIFKDPTKAARRIESEVKRRLVTGVVDRQSLPDGFTETTHLENLPLMLNIIEEFEDLEEVSPSQ